MAYERPSGLWPDFGPCPVFVLPFDSLPVYAHSERLGLFAVMVSFHLLTPCQSNACLP